MSIFSINPILLVSAVVPAALLLYYVFKSDRLERESSFMLLSLVLFGILATFGALLTEQIGAAILDVLFPQDSVAYNVLLYFVVVACSEEGFKYLLLKRRTWRSPEFNCQYDAVVYAVFVSLGFALWENIGYVAMYGLGTAAVRAFTAVPGHACFGVFMGAYYGLAKRYDSLGYVNAGKKYLSMSFLCPAALHGAYDYIATMSDPSVAWLFLVFIAIMFLVAWRLIKRLSRNDRFIDSRDNFRRY